MSQNKHVSVRAVLAAAVATAGTFTVSYPTGYSRTDFVRGVDFSLIVSGSSTYTAPVGIGVALNATSATITYRGTSTLPAGADIVFQFDAGGVTAGQERNAPARVKYIQASPYLVELGNPIATAANNIVTSQALLAATVAGATLASTLQVNSIVTLDVPRNVVAAWTGTSVLTVTGRDEFGVLMVESSASGTSFAGLKAFKTVTKVVVSADVTGLTVGTGKVLGMPCFLPGAGNVIREVQDLAVATAGTLVAGLAKATVSTALTADIRGTYAPSATPDGVIAFTLLCWLEDPFHAGNPQFGG